MEDFTESSDHRLKKSDEENLTTHTQQSIAQAQESGAYELKRVMSSRHIQVNYLLRYYLVILLDDLNRWRDCLSTPLNIDFLSAPILEKFNSDPNRALFVSFYHFPLKTGTGLFLGTAPGLAEGGPIGLLLAYTIMGTS
ncbi:hypothetical protein O181_011900 [Austropuccinia psidii MF-1]|uniref:Uncharacterized protein n=1 Tax=Austropuccinia psidii MF-1 TaxID=1389203 RepID=A0A9Q3BWT9_9BASI|nr:hypothetical protein [Austropuccinia psidii MF-1]